jgi:integrase
VVRQKALPDRQPHRRPFHRKEAPRARVLSDDELRDVWRASGSLDLPAPFRTIIKLLIVTGQRRGEIAALRSSYISHNQQTICLPGDLTKNHREHTFPIGPLGRSLIPTGEGLLFSAKGRPNRPFNGWSKSKIVLDELCGVSKWTLHDLRRTFRTNLGRLGVTPHIAERLVNHISARSDMEEVYDLYQYLPEMRAAAELWEGHLENILRG